MTASPSGASGAVGGVPYVQILGQVEIHGAPGTIASNRPEPARRLAAYLVLHPAGVHGAVLDDALCISRSYRLSVLSRLRTWLGQAPDGEDYLPPATDGLYRLQGAVRSDWDDFVSLTTGQSTPAAARIRRPETASSDTAPIDTLVQAMRLIHGRPFASGSPSFYTWASWHVDQMTTRIRSTAIRIAEHSLQERTFDQARWAIATAHRAGLTADESLARAELRVERAAGHREGVDRVIDRLHATARDLGSLLDPETTALIQAVRQQTRPTPADPQITPHTHPYLAARPVRRVGRTPCAQTNRTTRTDPDSHPWH